MAKSTKLSTAFEAVKTLGALYTGGHVEWCDGFIFTAAHGGVNIVQDGSVIDRVEEEEDPVLIFTAQKSNSNITESMVLITAHKSGLLRLWKVSPPAKPEIVKTFRSIHVGPISCIKLHELAGGGRILATGGADGTLKVWDLDHQYYTHNFRTTGGGVCTVIKFHPSKLILFGGFVSGELYSWDLTNSKQIHSLQGHHSAVTGLEVLEKENSGISCGRDKVVIVWNLATGDKLKTVPVSESVEGLCLADSDKLKVIIAAASSLRLWDLKAPRQLKEVSLGSEIVRLDARDQLLHCITADQNLVDVAVDSLAVVNTVVANNDEILDLVHLGQPASYLAVACNSPAIRLYQVDNWKCSLNPGHSDTVLCLAACPSDSALLASGSKDKEIRIWRLEDASLTCLLVGSGHTEALGGLAFSRQSAGLLLSVSKDTTIKTWSIDYAGSSMSSIRTEIAHDKEINCCDISPGDELVATGSQDKSAKLWTNDLRLVTTLRGHKRGIWCCQFSPADRLLATGSADAVVKIWSLSDHSCVKQLEGHDCSVLKLCWISGGQLVSSASDGLVKVWCIRKEECVATLDQSDDKVWALTSRNTGSDLYLVAGSASGQLTTWCDVTESAVARQQASAARTVVDQQKLANLLAGGQYGQALRLALRLSQPFTALKIIKKLEYAVLEEAVLCLDMPATDQLLGYTVKWNTNGRHCAAAQSVLAVILANYPPERLLQLPGCQDWVEGLLPYTEKHFQRLSRLQMKSRFLTFLVGAMKPTALPSEHLPNELTSVVK